MRTVAASATIPVTFAAMLIAITTAFATTAAYITGIVLLGTEPAAVCMERLEPDTAGISPMRTVTASATLIQPAMAMLEEEGTAVMADAADKKELNFSDWRPLALSYSDGYLKKVDRGLNFAGKRR